MASPLGDGLEILRSWSWFGKNRIAGWIQLGDGDEFMKCGCSEGEKRTEVIEEDTELLSMSGQR